MISFLRALKKAWFSLVLLAVLLTIILYYWGHPQFFEVVQSTSGAFGALVALFIATKTELVAIYRSSEKTTRLHEALVAELEFVATNLSEITRKFPNVADGHNQVFRKGGTRPSRPVYSTLNERIAVLPVGAQRVIAQYQRGYEELDNEFIEALKATWLNPAVLSDTQRRARELQYYAQKYAVTLKKTL